MTSPEEERVSDANARAETEEDELRDRFRSLSRAWGDAVRPAHRELTEALVAMDDIERIVRARARVNELEAVEKDLVKTGRRLFRPPRTSPQHPLGGYWWVT